MSVGEAKRKLYEAGLKIGRDSNPTSASGHTKKAALEVEKAEGLVNRNKEIGTEVDRRIARILDLLKGAQSEVSALSELLNEGISNGEKIQERGKNATSHVTSANDKWGEAKELVIAADALDDTLSGSFGVSGHRLQEAKEYPPAFIETGEHYATNYTAARQANEELEGALGLSRDKLTTLWEKSWKLGESGENGRTHIENAAEHLEVWTQQALGNTATSLSVRLQQLNM